MGLRSWDPIEVPPLPMPGVPNLTGIFHAGIFHHRPAYLWYRNATETPRPKFTSTTKNTVVTAHHDVHPCRLQDWHTTMN